MERQLVNDFAVSEQLHVHQQIIVKVLEIDIARKRLQLKLQ